MTPSGAAYVNCLDLPQAQCPPDSCPFSTGEQQGCWWLRIVTSARQEGDTQEREPVLSQVSLPGGPV